MKVDVTCFSCGASHSFSDLVPFRAECDKCSADLHVCLTCRFWDKYAENECREPEADPVANKDRRNLCEYWKPKLKDGAVDDAQAQAKAKLDALFKGAKPPSPSPSLPQASSSSGSSAADEAKRKLDELFKKKPT